MVGWIWSHTNYFAEMHCAHKNTNQNIDTCIGGECQNKGEKKCKSDNFLTVTLLPEARIVICR